ncbi:MAG: flagellar biosynthesis anti-sigma factor FlgM [Candidatus Omnitrophica bacterium]|nr:flagellar biosynthesis anti-sigma factor FlgM [Candidatus Omnitrophota bacterium]
MVDISGIGNTQNQANKITERSSTRSGGSKSNEASSSSSAASDRLEISAGAKQAGAVQRLTSLAQTSQDVRPEAVAQAREKLEKGEYEGVEVSRETAKKILGAT